VENPSLCVDGLLWIFAQLIVGDKRIDFILRNLIGCKIIIVEHLHGSTHTSLVMALGITAYVPSLGLSLSQKEIHLGRSDEDTRA
jgi:hypothetical protein